MTMRKCFTVTLFCLFLFNSCLFSQIVLKGIVSSAGMNPEPVQNALVELIDQADTNRVFSSTTDEQGNYSIQITQTGIGDAPVQKPGVFNLYQNYPNPFNPTTVISYELPHAADVRIEIYNVLGQKIKTLFDGYQSKLVGRQIWDGTNDHGQGVSAGVYIYSLSVEGTRINKKMLLIDGHTSNSNTAFAQTKSNVVFNGNVLNKPLSNNFLLRVSGKDIENWEQKDLEITSNMGIDITVYRTVTDKDGNIYRTIKIGDQWWMAENLKVTHYRNGDTIPNVTDSAGWAHLTTGAYCEYDNNIKNVPTYGRLYNWFALNDSADITPAGWHIPTNNDWQTLVDYLGGNAVTGSKLKEAGTAHWKSPNTDATNESGFTALPGGSRSDTGNFYNLTVFTLFGSISQIDSNEVWTLLIHSGVSDVSNLGFNKKFGFSVRCIKGQALPQLIYPPDSVIINDNKPVFDWNNVSDASVYELLVDNSSDFSSPEIVKDNLTDSGYTTADPLADGLYYWRVRCRDNENNQSNWSDVWSFTIDTQGPDMPVLLSPPDSATINNNTPEFDWADVSDASVYELVVDNSIDFSSPVIFLDTLCISHFTPTDSLPDDLYYWKVRSKDNQGNYGAWSSVWHFTIDTQGPDAPILLSPLNNAVIYDNTPEFDWTDVSDAVSYTIIINILSDFSAPPTIATNVSYSRLNTAPITLAEGLYFWRVRCQDAQGNLGAWSEVWSFTIQPGIVKDIDGNVYQTIKIGDQLWMAENLMVTHYQNGDPIPNVTDATEWTNLTAGAYCEYSNNVENVTTYGRLYNWYAVDDNRKLAPAGWHVPTDNEWQILVHYLGGIAVAGGKLKEKGLVHWKFPNAGATNESGFTGLPGGSRNGGNGDFVYKGEVASFWSSTEFHTPGFAIGWALSILNPQITTFNVNTRQGASIRCIKGPEPTALLSPAHQETLIDNTPVFDWTEVDSATTYELVVDNSNDFSSPEIVRDNLTESGYIAVDPLADGLYFWRVRCRDRAGILSDWSVVWSFIIDTAGPEAPTLFSPSDSAIINDNTPAFDWSDVDDAYYYDLLVDDSIDFSSPEINLTIPTESGYTATESLAYGQYFWKVRGVNNQNNRGAWSETWSFSIDTLITGTVTDIDGNVYKTVKIGNQWWMAENLKVTKYSSGDAIPNITSNSEWTNLTTGAYCYIDNSDSNAAVFGALYNWYAVDDSRNIAPDGWHVPTDNDWQILVDFLGGDAIAGGKLKEAGTAHWLSPNTGATNESGFTARAGGLRSSFDGGFVYKGTFANFWSSTRENSDYVWCRQLKYEFEEIWDGVAHYEAGFSIRLVKD